MTHEQYGLGGDDKNRVPKAEVTHLNSVTRVRLPYEVFNRCNTATDRRTFNFFTEPGEVHEGQWVMITTYGDHTEPVAWGQVERADTKMQNKWFVQTSVSAPTNEVFEDNSVLT